MSPLLLLAGVQRLEGTPATILRKLTVAALAAATLLLGVTAAGGSHSWEAFHWPDDHLSPTVASRTTSSLYNVPAAVEEWADLGTPIQPVFVPGTSADVVVASWFSFTWLGLARIFVDADGHITRGQVLLNTPLLRFYSPAVADHVLCQETGHIWGLEHNRDGDIGGTPDNTCMNDVGHLGQYTTPNSHDVEQLNTIYNHADGASEPASSGGRWITVHAFPIP